jgi:hypothetical protein
MSWSQVLDVLSLSAKAFEICPQQAPLRERFAISESSDDDASLLHWKHWASRFTKDEVSFQQGVIDAGLVWVLAEPKA